jgi:uncharacterized protein
LKPLIILFIALAALIAGCQDKQGTSVTTPSMPTESNELAFVCVHEDANLPLVTPEAEQIFQQARSAEKAPGPKNFNAIAKLYEKAGALNHWKALQNLQVLYYEELVDHKNHAAKVIEITEQMIKLNIPIGFYNMATYLEQGYGVKQDQEKALAFYRKSADLGNPNGQQHVGYILTFKLKQFEVGKKMLMCAVEQGNGKAAQHLESHLRSLDAANLPTSLMWLQKSAELGYPIAFTALTDTFTNGDKAMINYNTGVDLERAKRYSAMHAELRVNPAARFPDINKIVPLPPAPLPAWDGSFEYKKAVK